MKKETREKLNSMKMTDVYSLVLFALFKLREIPEYSSLSELAYTLDGTSLFNFLEYFGGTTIKVPTLDEFRVIIEALLLYQYVNVEGIEYNQALNLMENAKSPMNEIKSCYSKLVTILKDYEFKRN